MIIVGLDNSIIGTESIAIGDDCLINNVLFHKNIIKTYDVEMNSNFSIGDYFDGISFTKREVAPIKIEVPQTITKLQAMKQMKVIGKWEAFKAVLANDEDVNDEWLLSDNLNRTYPLVLGIGQLFGFTDDDMDNFFIEASKVV